jgi:hypothetical protein
MTPLQLSDLDYVPTANLRRGAGNEEFIWGKVYFSEWLSQSPIYVLQAGLLFHVDITCRRRDQTAIEPSMHVTALPPSQMVPSASYSI